VKKHIFKDKLCFQFSKKMSIHKCIFCEYLSMRKYNTIRHMNIKHNYNENEETNVNLSETNVNLSETNVNLSETNVNLSETNVNLSETNVNLSETNVNLSETNVNLFNCDVCGKVFKSKIGYNKHRNKCKGIRDILECHICHKSFASSSSKSRHLKICKISNKKKEINSNNVKITNNIINNITNNTVINNCNINIISFDKNLKNDTKFNTEHISFTDLRKILVNNIYDENNIQRLYSDYYRLVCDDERNRCIKKSNIKSDISKIHSGNGEWITMLDRDIYNKLVKDVSTDLLTKIDENEIEMKRTFERTLLMQANAMYDMIDTYTNKIYSDEKHLIKSLKEIMKSLKCIIIDYTIKMII